VRCRSLDADRVYRLEVGTGGRKDVGPLVVEAWKPHDETFRLPRTREIGGVVVDASGRPIARATVSRPSVGLEVAEWTTQADGGFRLGRFADGPLTLTARASGYVAREVAVEVGPSLGPITIALSEGREARARVDGWRGGAQASLFAFDETRADDERAPGGEVGADGLVVLKDVDFSRTYTLWMRAPADTDLYVLARGVRLGDAETHVALSRGGSIRGHAILPPNARNVGWSARAGFLVVGGTMSDDGNFEFRGVPPGVFAIEIHCVTDGTRWAGTAKGAAGDVVTVTLEPTD
jgi:hypothetical protein